jgi:hypothetical protein
MIKHLLHKPFLEILFTILATCFTKLEMLSPAFRVRIKCFWSMTHDFTKENELGMMKAAKALVNSSFKHGPSVRRQSFEK